MLVSSTEPKRLVALGKSSRLPERYGVDFLWTSQYMGMVGVQRKEVGDWVASYFDGRLKTLKAQAKALDVKILLMEGTISFSQDGALMGQWGKRFTREMHLSQLFSMMDEGFWVVTSSNLGETFELLSFLEKWTSRPSHSGLSRPKANGSSSWGKASNRDWGIHVLEGFDGIGSEVAAAIYDHFQGLPLSWSASEEELRQVVGVGKVRARKLLEALERDEVG